MCVAGVIFEQERRTEQFFSMRFFHGSVFLFTIQCSSPSEHFAFNAFFLWEHALYAPEGGELHLVRTVGMVRLGEILFETLSKKWHWPWDHHNKFTVVHRLHQGFPTWGTCTPGSAFKVSNRRQKYIYMLFIFKSLYTYHLILFFKSHYICTVKCICEKSWENILS